MADTRAYTFRYVSIPGLVLALSLCGCTVERIHQDAEQVAAQSAFVPKYRVAHSSRWSLGRDLDVVLVAAAGAAKIPEEMAPSATAATPVASATMSASPATPMQSGSATASANHSDPVTSTPAWLSKACTGFAAVFPNTRIGKTATDPLVAIDVPTLFINIQALPPSSSRTAAGRRWLHRRAEPLRFEAVITDAASGRTLDSALLEADSRWWQTTQDRDAVSRLFRRYAESLSQRH